jgi:hypothetical protein
MCTPKDLGGLGILDLKRLARAPRMRWCWFQWKHSERPWIGLEIPCDKKDKDLFYASTTVSVGNGKKANFWQSAWVNGKSLEIWPLSYSNDKRGKTSRFIGGGLLNPGSPRRLTNCASTTSLHRDNKGPFGRASAVPKTAAAVAVAK